jgi:hypothetical protein
MTDKGLRLEATRELELRADAYCPDCCAPLTFKRGRIVTAHFAHRTTTSCTAANEGREHLEAKAAILRTFRGMGYRAEPEYRVNVGRRIDVAVWGGNKGRLAFEIQASPIDPVAMHSREFDHARAGFTTRWIFTSSRCPGLLSTAPYVGRSPGEVRVPHEMHHLALVRDLEVIDRNGALWSVDLIPVIRPGYCFIDSYGDERYTEETTLKSTFHVDRFLVEWSEYAEVLGQQLILIGSE